MVHEIVEGKINWLHSIDLADIPDELPLKLKVHVRDGCIGLEPDSIVGAIPLNSGDTVKIIPKVGTVCFLELLIRAEGNQSSLRQEFEDIVEVSSIERRGFEQLIYLPFMAALDEILRKSPMQERKNMKFRSKYLVGNISFRETALNIAAKKLADPIVSTKKVKTTDSPENRLLSSALINCFHELSSDSQHKYISVFERWKKRIGLNQLSGNDLNIIENRFNRVDYGGPRAYYKRALTLARIIMGSHGLSLDGTESLNSSGFLINTPDVYEKYIRNVLASAYTEQGYLVKKGSTSFTSLYVDGSYELMPDVYIEKSGTPLLIIDAKYKKPSASDHYQLIVYLAEHRVNKGVLISPNFHSDEVEIINYKSESGFLVKEIYLPMSNLKRSEEFLTNLIENVD